MIIGITGNTNDNQIDASELFALVKTAATIPTCVQYKGRLGKDVICDVHFYGKMTNGCTVWPIVGGKIIYSCRKFKSWNEVMGFIKQLALQEDVEQQHEQEPPCCIEVATSIVSSQGRSK